ncbi:hypothetical protein ABBQ38_002836 [Trebouxia sp. C0009 RCD-2024]
MQKVRVVDTCVIRAVSLEYEYTCSSGDFGNDAILSTCDSFMCGGQVEPTADTDNLVLSHQDIDGVTERLAMSKAFFYEQCLDAECIKHGISNLVAGYPVLAGRLGKTAGTGQPCIQLNNAGVQFRHLQSSASRGYFQANSPSAGSRRGAALPNWTEVCKIMNTNHAPRNLSQ